MVTVQCCEWINAAKDMLITYHWHSTGLGGIMGMMNESTEASESETGGWLDGVSYWAGLSGGSWATGTFMSNGGQLPTNLLENVGFWHDICVHLLTCVIALEHRFQSHLS